MSDENSNEQENQECNENYSNIMSSTEKKSISNTSSSMDLRNKINSKQSLKRKHDSEEQRDNLNILIKCQSEESNEVGSSNLKNKEVFSSNDIELYKEYVQWNFINNTLYMKGESLLNIVNNEQKEVFRNTLKSWFNIINEKFQEVPKYEYYTILPQITLEHAAVEILLKQLIENKFVIETEANKKIEEILKLISTNHSRVVPHYEADPLRVEYDSDRNIVIVNKFKSEEVPRDNLISDKNGIISAARLMLRRESFGNFHSEVLGSPRQFIELKWKNHSRYNVEKIKVTLSSLDNERRMPRNDKIVNKSQLQPAREIIELEWRNYCSRNKEEKINELYKEPERQRPRIDKIVNKCQPQLSRESNEEEWRSQPRQHSRDENIVILTIPDNELDKEPERTLPRDDKIVNECQIQFSRESNEEEWRSRSNNKEEKSKVTLPILRVSEGKRQRVSSPDNELYEEPKSKRPRVSSPDNELYEEPKCKKPRVSSPDNELYKEPEKTIPRNDKNVNKCQSQLPREIKELEWRSRHREQHSREDNKMILSCTDIDLYKEYVQWDFINNKLYKRGEYLLNIKTGKEKREFTNTLQRWLIFINEDFNEVPKYEYFSILPDIQLEHPAAQFLRTAIIEKKFATEDDADLKMTKILSFISRNYSEVVPHNLADPLRVEHNEARNIVVVNKFQSKKMPRVNLLVTKGGVIATARVLLRYESLGNGSYQWGDPDEVYKVLHDKFYVRYEGFASPVNSGLIEYDETHFCSLFPETDAAFGSIGNFFDVDMKKHFGGWKVNPPFLNDLMKNVAIRIIETLDAGHKCYFFCTFPCWKDDDGWIILNTSRHLLKRFDLPPNNFSVQDAYGRKFEPYMSMNLFVMGKLPPYDNEKARLRELENILIHKNGPR